MRLLYLAFILAAAGASLARPAVIGNVPAFNDLSTRVMRAIPPHSQYNGWALSHVKQKAAVENSYRNGLDPLFGCQNRVVPEDIDKAGADGVSRAEEARYKHFNSLLNTHTDLYGKDKAMQLERHRLAAQYHRQTAHEIRGMISSLSHVQPTSPQRPRGALGDVAVAHGYGLDPFRSPHSSQVHHPVPWVPPAVQRPLHDGRPRRTLASLEYSLQRAGQEAERHETAIEALSRKPQRFGCFGC